MVDRPPGAELWAAAAEPGVGAGAAQGGRAPAGGAHLAAGRQSPPDTGASHRPGAGDRAQGGPHQARRAGDPGSQGERA